MIYASGLNYGQKQEEIIQMDKMGFPYACYYRAMDGRFNTDVQWHWHKSIEIDYLIEGELVLETSGQTQTLHKGDLCLINSEALHSFHTTSQSGCEFYAHLFHAAFLSGAPNSQIERRYIHPILGSNCDAWHFPADSPGNADMAALYLHIVELDQQHPFGYEFAIREALSRLWCLFFQQINPPQDTSIRKQAVDSTRIKGMIQYIHEHYEEMISLGDIAGAAGVSRQECMRCFRKYIHTSPVAYLTEYRVRMAAEQLLSTDQSIIAVSERNGFSSNSYFSKVFRRTMGCTPKEYRCVNGSG